MMCKRFIEALLLLALAATQARADDAFKQHYEAGLSLYSSESYEEAIKEFQAAYAIRPKPRLLFNIGQSYRSLGNARDALRFYLLYQALESNPKPGLKAELEGYILQMKSIVERAEQARRAEDRPALPPADPPGIIVADTPPPTPAGTGPMVLTATPARPIYKRGWFWGVVGGSAAAAVLVIGLSVGLTTRDSYGGIVRNPTF